jgi:Helix-turn-helix domain
MSSAEVVTAARATLAQRLRALRGVEGWSLSQAAIWMGYHKSSVSRAEHEGICSLPVPRTAERQTQGLSGSIRDRDRPGAIGRSGKPTHQYMAVSV